MIIWYNVYESDKKAKKYGPHYEYTSSDGSLVNVKNYVIVGDDSIPQ